MICPASKIDAEVDQVNARRIADYQRGWNDASAHRTTNTIEPTAYHVGFIEAMSRTPNRFHDYEGA